MNLSSKRKFTLMTIYTVFLCSIMFYFLDSAADSFIFDDGSFIEQLTAPSPMEAWVRAFVCFLFIVFGAVVIHFNSRMIDERNNLLKEMHHRTKNNLTIIMSLLSLTKSRAESEMHADILMDSRNRLRSVAAVHEQLQFNEGGRSINFAKYIDDLSKNVYSCLRSGDCDISISTDIPDINMELEYAIPCGLIVNELLTNSIKHAFGDTCEGEIHIGFRVKRNECTLVYRDNGSGLPEGAGVKRESSLGLMIIDSQVRQLDGSMRVLSEAGTEYRITFSIAGARSRQSILAGSLN